MSLSPWWGCVANAKAPEDDFEKRRAAAVAASNAECQAAIDAMRRTAQAEILEVLDGIPVENMARA